jgi:hypothetical protein
MNVGKNMSLKKGTTLKEILYNFTYFSILTQLREIFRADFIFRLVHIY